MDRDHAGLFIHEKLCIKAGCSTRQPDTGAAGRSSPPTLPRQLVNRPRSMCCRQYLLVLSRVTVTRRQLMLHADPPAPPVHAKRRFGERKAHRQGCTVLLREDEDRSTIIKGEMRRLMRPPHRHLEVVNEATPNSGGR